MPRDSQGLYSLPLPAVRPGDLIESAWANTTLNDVANALTGSLPRDGTAAMTGALTLSAAPITGLRQATTKEYVDNFMAFGSGLAVGAVIAYSGSVAPIGYLLCNGQAVSRTTYADLFTAIGTTYGAGNGSTTFNVPNLVGQFIRGREAGRQLGSAQTSMVEPHNHGLIDPGHGHFVNDPGHTHTQLSHTHAINDPGHGHQMTDKVGSTAGNGLGLMVADSSATETPTNRVVTVNNGTGITLSPATAVDQNNLTGITVNTNITGASVAANAGTETRPANIGMDYYIKAVKDATGGGGGSTSAANVSFVAGGTIVATNVQAAINELDNETQVALAGKAAVGSTTPLINGTATAGVSTSASRQDHVHPTDTTRAPLASPALTGTPTAPTALAGTNSTQIATTAFVTAAVAAGGGGGGGGGTPSDADPSMDGTASPGIISNFSRGDHVHPSDTSRAPASAATATGTAFTAGGTISATNVQAAITELDSETQASLALKAPLASPALTGNPTAPTQASGDSSTRLATTAFVAAAVTAVGGLLPSNNNPLMNGAVSPGVGVSASRDDHVHPTDTSRAPLASPTFTGTPAAPTATAGTNTTQLATTAFVAAAISGATASIPSGSVMLFAQAATPTGWTRITTDSANNRMLRVVNSGSGGGVGGSDSPITMSVVPSHTHTITTGSESVSHNHTATVGVQSAQHSHGVTDPGHSHTGGVLVGSSSSGNSLMAAATGSTENPSARIIINSGTTGISVNTATTDHNHTVTLGNASVSHTHSGTTAANSGAANWAPRYVDLLMCSKN